MGYEQYLLSLGYSLAYLVIFLIIFAESGLFFGFFLPGDSLLFTLGVLASQGHFSILLLLILGSVAAITGDSVGYAFGRKIGPSLFNRESSRFFKKEQLHRAQEFYEKYGIKTIVLARFVPFARTFAPILAGIGEMNYRVFLAYNMLGGIGWILLVTLAGYFLGSRIHNVDHYILLIVLIIVVISAVPALLHFKATQKKKPGKNT